jgi:histone-lysine N-methyltransferase SETMAR
MVDVFWDSEGAICVDLPHGVTINEQYCSNLLHYDMHQAVQNKIPGKLTNKRILLHGNPHPHMAYLMKATSATVGWKIMNHPSYSPDLAPSDFNLFGPMKVHLGQISN